jgi:HSP20 family protein
MSWTNDEFENFIDRILRQWGINPELNSATGDPKIRKWTYGYSMTMGPDGKPLVREWGTGLPNQDIEQGFPQPTGQQVSEPLTQVDCDATNMKVRVLVEMPGVSKESVKVKATETAVRVTASHGGKDYDVEVPLNAKVDPKSAKATCNNGVLDLTLDMLEAPQDDGVYVPVN